MPLPAAPTAKQPAPGGLRFESGRELWRLYFADIGEVVIYCPECAKHIGGIDEPCFLAGLCAIREFSQIMTLEITAPPPPPPPPRPPRYQASVRSIHPNAIRLPGNWTYLGDTVKVRFRNANARPGDAQRYRVCNTTGSGRLVCRSRVILSRSWDAFRLRITRPLVGSSRWYIAFTWRVEGRIVARRRIKVFSDE